MKVLVLIDRDGVLIYDDKYHLGSTNDWKEKVKVLPKVVDGLKLLDTLPDVGIYALTNQPGVVVKEFPKLTLERAKEVCGYVIDKINGMGGNIKDCFLCPHASLEYAKKRGDKYTFDKDLVHECNCFKPNLDMVFKALESEGVGIKDANIYVIGDRVTDIKTAINASGFGILVPFENEPGQEEEVKKLGNKDIHIAKDFLEAAKFIVDREK